MRCGVAALAATALLALAPVGAADPASLRTACAAFGGVVGADQFCQVHDTSAISDLTLQFPVDYPDGPAVADYLTRSRENFLDRVDANPAPARAAPFALAVVGRVYQSGDRQSGTQSLVLTVGDDTGVHPVTIFKTFNYDLAARAPITFATLFQPGSDPVSVLNPLVRPMISARDPAAPAARGELTAASYQQFAITDDVITFFFNQDGLLPHEDGPLEVAVPRGGIASILR